MTRRALVLSLALVGACHASIRFQDTRTGEVRTVRTAAAPRVLPLVPQIDDRGRLVFVEPLLCATETTTDVASFDVVRQKPNAATLVVGVITSGLGFVAATAGLLSEDPGGTPLSYVGPGAIAVGLPLVIGPLVGNTIERNPTGVQEVRRPGPDERCGARPVAGRHATVLWSGLHIEGAVDADGAFALSPFDFVDAFEPRLQALDLAIDLVRADGTAARLDTVIDASTLAAARAGFFAARGLDATVPTLAELGKVAQYEPGPLAVSLGDGGLKVALPIDNVGPGRGYGLRVVLASSSTELDGRVLYLGALAAGARATLTATIPLTDEAARAVAAPGFALAALIRDGHGLAPPTPVRWRGVVLRTGS
ncbi:MAG: hypothetical protein IPL61_32605 [Myxococcales bacterium]|nr:hypothetical protein [Myxococcales bacterium]